MDEPNDPCNVLSVTDEARGTLECWLQGYTEPYDDGTTRRVRAEGDDVYRFEDPSTGVVKKFRISVNVEVVQ